MGAGWVPVAPTCGTEVPQTRQDRPSRGRERLKDWFRPRKLSRPVSFRLFCIFSGSRVSCQAKGFKNRRLHHKEWGWRGVFGVSRHFLRGPQHISEASRDVIMPTQHFPGSAQHVFDLSQHLFGVSQHFLASPQHYLRTAQHFLKASQHLFGRAQLLRTASRYVGGSPQDVVAWARGVFGSRKPQGGFRRTLARFGQLCPPVKT